jgi:hypothetical protein
MREERIKEENNPKRRSSEKSARVRRREIEHLRKAGALGGSSGRNEGGAHSDEDGDQHTARERMRELEVVRQQMNASPGSLESLGADVKQKAKSGSGLRNSNHSVDSEAEEKRKEEGRRKRKEQRKERAQRQSAVRRTEPVGSS